MVGGISEEDAVVVENSGEGEPPAPVYSDLEPISGMRSPDLIHGRRYVLADMRLLLYHGMCCTIAVASNTGDNIQYVS